MQCDDVEERARAAPDTEVLHTLNETEQGGCGDERLSSYIVRDEQM